MKMNLTMTVGCLLAVGPVLAGEPAFTSMPAVTKAADGKTKIAFAVDRECDVAVYIENAGGETVRHLVAGLLGKNAPEPLKPGSLAQAIEWDGKDDDGRDVADTRDGLRVRVGLGLNASWGGTAFSEKTGPNHISSIEGLATGSDGRVYVMD
jgi:hypothetical protein